ncbi:MAG TPA: ABC transporter ATP-binding protein [Chthoniobacter sp.]|nr:ABC transporter ATP-binding protein [Chthoniobacter sp.]
MPEPVIVLDQLAKSFGDTAAVNGVTMSIPAGEIFGFLGANGAGKTTTMRMLCGLTKPTSGAGHVLGHDIWKGRHAIRPKFGYVAQKFSLYPDLTVLENLRFFGAAYQVSGKKLEARMEALLDQLDLRSKSKALAGSLSGGMKQMLALSCALVHEPALLFLDEPTSGLDPVHRQQIWDLLYDLSSQGTTIFVTTHYMDEAERCTEVGFLHQGRLLAKETPLRLKQRFKGQLLEMQVEPVMEGLVRLRSVPGILGVALRSGRVRIYSGESEQLVAQWQKQWPFEGLTWLGHSWAVPDMEDVFKAYSQGYSEILQTTAP